MPIMLRSVVAPLPRNAIFRRYCKFHRTVCDVDEQVVVDDDEVDNV